MGVRRYQDLIAWQMAEGFKSEVFRIVLASPRASARLAKSQLAFIKPSRPPRT